jgi:hypothetical protein
MLINREGRFRGRITEAGVGETGKSQLCTWTANIVATEEWNGSEWVDCTDERLTITNYSYLERKDGNLNEIQINALKAALGWDGKDIDYLQQCEKFPMIQFTVKGEEYEGKLRYKVGFINPYDYEGGGGVVRSDAQGVKKLQSRLGTKLRALSGGSNVAPPKPAAPAPPAPPAAPAAVTEAQAWEMFYAKAKEVGLSDDQAGALFLREKQTGRSLADLASYSFEELPF